jgi:predicted amidohydrolase YtcJ
MRPTMSLLSHSPFRVPTLLAVLVTAACASEPENPADLVLRGGKVVTVDSAVPDGQAIAVKDGRILAVASDREIRQYIGKQTEVIELEGQLAIPGFIESHGHFMGVGQQQTQLNLMDIANWDEAVAMVEFAAKDIPVGQLITGRGWHQEKWNKRPENHVEGNPTHHALSAVTPNNPVILTHASGHASFANAKAMELAGITRSTPNPPGGEIVKDAAGEPIGLFRETAQGLLGAARRNAAPADPRRHATLASEEVLSHGITTFHDAGSSFQTVDLLKDMVDKGELGVRLWVMIRAPNDRLRENLGAYRMVGYGGDMLTVRAIKVTIDGALGSHGAWLLEPYNDLPTSSGLNTIPIPSLEQTAELAMANDFQLCVHAIGDRGNREVLNVFEAAFKANPEKSGLRWRIEHAQHLNPADIPRFGQLGVIAAMQGVHATSDGPWVEAKLGEQRAREGAYVWQDLMKTGAVIANGTDAPVEKVDAIASYYASVSRMTNQGTKFYPAQAMSRMEALRSYTINGAYAAFEEGIKGSLTPGKLADITVLSKDILTVPEEEIPTAEVVYTIVGGKVKYRKE